MLERVKPTIFAEPSGDACDHYHRYADDIKMLAGLGLNTYRYFQADSPLLPSGLLGPVQLIRVAAE